MAHPTITPDTTLRITRTFAAPRERVFRAWTEPEQLKRWWGPPGYGTPVAEVDLRVGGRYRFGMRHLPDGEIFYLSGTYREVTPPARLVYTWRWEGEPDGQESRVTVEFNDRGASTDVVVLHEMFASRDERDKHEQGWTGCLERLVETLAAG